MKKLMIGLFAAGMMATSAFAAAELTDANKQAITDALAEAGWTISEIALDDAGNYAVTATNKDGKQALLVVNEAYEIVSEGAVVAN